MNSDAILLFTVIPLFGSFLTLIEKAIPSVKVTKPVTIGTFFLGVILLGLFGSSIYEGTVYTTVVGGWPEGIGIGQQLEGLSWVALVLTYLIYLPILLFSFSEGGYDTRFYFFLLLLQGGMAGIVLAYDVFNLFVFLEITGIAAYTLIAYQKKERALFAGFKYLMLSSLGITLFLVGVYIFYRDTGSLQYSSLMSWMKNALTSPRIAPNPLNVDILIFGTGTAILSIGTSFALATLLAGIGVRTAFLPYTWLPDAHGFAPHPVSASLSGVVIKVSFIVVWKLITLLHLTGAREFLLWMGSAIALIGVLRALTQTDVKVLLAWHSVSQMGYIFAGFGSGNELAVVGSLYHMASHAFFKALLFLSVGTVILFTGERNLKKVSGMGRYFPYLGVLFTIGALSIMGVPPFVGYVSKNLLFKGLQGHSIPYWLLFAASVGTVASFTKLSLLFRGTPTLRGKTIAFHQKAALLKTEGIDAGNYSEIAGHQETALPKTGLAPANNQVILEGVGRGTASGKTGPAPGVNQAGVDGVSQAAASGKTGPAPQAPDGHTDSPLRLPPTPFGWGYGGMTLLAVFCVIGGILGVPGIQFFSKILSSEGSILQGSEGAKGAVFLWMNVEEYLKTAITLALGYGVYRFIVSKRGKAVQEWANRMRISFDNQLGLLLVGVLLITVFLIRGL